MAGAGEFDVSIVVICFDRMQLLERTLRACMAQAAPAGARWEIVVADNHPDQLAAPLVARLGADARLRHVAAWPAKNIAAARNAGVAAARGRMVAFCDDDEAPDPDWMIEHLACLRRTGADASFGPKYPVFEGGAAPPWDPDGWFFTVDFGLPPDADIRPLEWSLRGGRGVGAGNSMLLRRAAWPPPSRSMNDMAAPAAKTRCCSSDWPSSAGVSCGVRRRG